MLIDVVRLALAKRVATFMCATALWLCGCATAGNGFDQEIGIASVPAAARVIVDGKKAGVTPLVLDLARRSDHQIRIELAGYTPQEVTLDRRVSRWGLGADALLVFQPWFDLVAIRFPYVLPLTAATVGGLDLALGGLFEFVPDHVTATLVPLPPTAK